MAKSKRPAAAPTPDLVAKAVIPPIGGSFVIGVAGEVTPGDEATAAHLEVHLAGGDPGAPAAPEGSETIEAPAEPAAEENPS